MIWSIRTIAPEDAPKVWPIVAPMIAQAVALSEGRYDMRAVFDDIQKRRSLLWVVYDEARAVCAAFTARTTVYPRASYLCIEFLGGEDMRSWVESADEVLSQYARDAGLNGLELVGRSGWARPLATFGWRQNAVMLVKPISAGVAQDEAA